VNNQIVYSETTIAVRIFAIIIQSRVENDCSNNWKGMHAVSLNKLSEYLL